MRWNPKPENKPLLSVAETAELLGMSTAAMYRALQAGDFPIPTFTIGRRIRIPRAAVERLINGELPVSAAPAASETEMQ